MNTKCDGCVHADGKWDVKNDEVFDDDYMFDGAIESSIWDQICDRQR